MGPLVENTKTKNFLYVMKRILYDMGHLTVAKWLLQRALKFNITYCLRSLLRRVSLYGGCQKHPEGVFPQILGWGPQTPIFWQQQSNPPLNFGIKTRTHLNLGKNKVNTPLR